MSSLAAQRFQRGIGGRVAGYQLLLHFRRSGSRRVGIGQMDGLRDSKVEYLCNARARHKNVPRLEIAMDYALAVGVRQRIRDTEDERNTPVAAQSGVSVVQELVQRLAVDQFHDHEQQPTAFIAIEDMHVYDIGMRELLGAARLSLHERQCIRVAGKIGDEQLHRDIRVALASLLGQQVAGPPDLPHSPGTDQLLESIVSLQNHACEGYG